jgi:adenosylcobinamide-GDP ribazoletransferase
VGLIVGAISAGVMLAAADVWTGVLPILIAITLGILATGAFHEDGLADTADGLGGGQDAAHRMAIMKDSRIGTYGVLALVACLALKVAALGAFEVPHAALLLFVAHGLGRGAAVIAMSALPYASDPDAAKSKPAPVGVTTGECVLGIILGAWPVLLLPIHQAMAGIALGGVFAAALALTSRKLIGGYTGDVLGGTEQVFEVGFLLGAAAVL